MKNKTIGIYLITERAAGRDVYVGQGDVYDRWKKHRSKYPEELFDYRILLECPRTELNLWEQHYIRVLKTHWTEGGDNQTWGGQHWPRPEEPLSLATRRKLSEANRVRHASMTEEAKRELYQKISESGKAYEASMTEEAKRERSQKLSKAQKTRHANMTEEGKQKRSEAIKAALAVEETKQKRSEAIKAALAVEETKQKRSEAMKAHYSSLSEEEKQNWFAARKAGYDNMPEEAKQKRSEAMKARHASLTEEEKRERSLKISEAVKAAASRKRFAKAAAYAALEALISLESNTENIPLAR
jgi:hypothetical protein